MRLSNFLLWQAAYAELLFLDILWPDFDEQAFADALDQFAARAAAVWRPMNELSSATVTGVVLIAAGAARRGRQAATLLRACWSPPSRR